MPNRPRDLNDQVSDSYIRERVNYFLRQEVRRLETSAVDTAALTYITVDDESTGLPNSRVLAVGDGLNLSDGGAGGSATLTVGLTETGPLLSFDSTDLQVDLTNPAGSLTTLATGDLFLVGDVSASTSNKTITTANLVSSLITNGLAGNTPSFVTINGEASLTNERRLEDGTAIAFTDGGPGGTVQANYTYTGVATNNSPAGTDTIMYNDLGTGLRVMTLDSMISSLLTEGEGIDITSGTVAMDVPSLTEETTVDLTADEIVIYDNSAAAHRKIPPADMRAAMRLAYGVGGSAVISPTGPINTVTTTEVCGWDSVPAGTVQTTGPVMWFTANGRWKNNHSATNTMTPRIQVNGTTLVSHTSDAIPLNSVNGAWNLVMCLAFEDQFGGIVVGGGQLILSEGDGAGTGSGGFGSAGASDGNQVWAFQGSIVGIDHDTTAWDVDSTLR